jgi:3-methyladenine DNA glycosylase AlkD
VVTLAGRIENALAGRGTTERAVKEKAYLKSELAHLGIPVPQIRAAVRAELAAEDAFGRAELLATVDALWAKRVHESRMAAVELLVMRAKLLTVADVPVLERLLRESKTWAYVDALAVHAVGPLVAQHASLAPTLDRWAKDDDFWIRRSAMLALLAPLRKGGGDFARFARYADAMLDEREFFIRKAIGWILRETSRKQPKIVFDWLLPRAARASGVTMREAVKYLTAAQRSKLDFARARDKVRS